MSGSVHRASFDSVEDGNAFAFDVPDPSGITGGSARGLLTTASGISSQGGGSGEEEEDVAEADEGVCGLGIDLSTVILALVGGEARGVALDALVLRQN